MTEFKWAIANTEYTNDDEKYISILHWRCDGSDGEHSIGAYGTQSFTKSEGETITEFSKVTEEIALQWLFEKLNKEEIEAAVQAKLDELANPPLISGLPW